MIHVNSTRWRTSSHSGGNGGECVQVAAEPSTERVLVRDSKNPNGPVLALPSAVQVPLHIVQGTVLEQDHHDVIKRMGPIRHQPSLLTHRPRPVPGTSSVQKLAVHQRPLVRDHASVQVPKHHRPEATPVAVDLSSQPYQLDTDCQTVAVLGAFMYQDRAGSSLCR